MKKYAKHIRFENIVLNVEKVHPKLISRVIFTLHQENGSSHKTKKYGDVDSSSIQWNSPIEFLYTAQASFKFQTNCQHEFGYQIQDLKALYNGVIRIRPQDFFHVNRFTVFNNHGQQCGRLSAMIKVVDRQIGVKYNQEDEIVNKEHIRVDLVGKITFYSAKLVVNSHNSIHYQNKNRKLKLSLDLSEKIINGVARESYKWSLNDAKIQIFQSTAKVFPVKIQQNGVTLLQGKLQMESIINNKRFLTQTIQVANTKNQKIGILQIDMRYVTKKQILDLMYSPSKLQGIKMEKIQNNAIQFLKEKISLQHGVSLLRKKNTEAVLKKNKSYSTDQNHKSMDLSDSPFKKSRIQLYMKQKHLLNENSSKFPHDQRWKQIKPKNPYISYVGQQMLSDFSPKRKNRGASMSSTQKYDFTKRYKDNPGVGNYHLPSIFDK